MLGVSLSALHLNGKFWPRPQEFDPSRFLDSTTDLELAESEELNMEGSRRMHPFQFLPFSAGPHNCIGQKFALREAMVTLLHLTRAFRIDLHEDPARPVKPVMHGLQMAANLRVAFVPL